jgi:TRAP transporter TAXI family solute receptor
MRKLFIGVLAATAFAAAPAVAQDKFNLTLAGASPGGLWSALGAGLDKTLAKAYPGSTVTYQTGGGGLANAKLVQDKKVPMGLAVDPELAWGYRGMGPYKGKPQKDLRVLLRVYSAESRFQYMHVLINGDVAKQYNIKTMDDVKKHQKNLRVAFNRPGNIDGEIGIASFTKSGVDIKPFKQVVRAASQEMTSLMQDRRIDMQVFGISYNHARIRELDKGIPLNMIGLNPKAVDAMIADFGGKACTIKASEYKFIQEDKLSHCVGGVVMVHKDMPDETAYKIVKGVLTNIDTFRSAHRALQKATTPQSLAEGSVAPHHPGALKAYREAGLAK